MAGDQGEERGFARCCADVLEHGPDAGPEGLFGLGVQALEAVDLPGQPVSGALLVLRDVPELFERGEQVVGGTAVEAGAVSEFAQTGLLRAAWRCVRAARTRAARTGSHDQMTLDSIMLNYSRFLFDIVDQWRRR